MESAPATSEASTPPRPKNRLFAGVKTVLSCLFLPTSWKRAAVFVAFWGILQPLAGTLFPRAEDVVKKEGLDPAVVEMLAPGKKIHIRQGDNPLAKVHAAMDHSILMPWHYFSTMRKGTSVMAYTIDDDQDGLLNLPLKILLPKSQRFCTIYMKPHADMQDMSAIRDVVEDIKGPVAWKHAVSPTKQELYQMYLLHEIRHCSNDNMKLERGYDQEADATWKAIATLAAQKRNPALVAAFKKTVAINIGGNYDHSLYIDAMQKGAKPPSAEEVEAVSAEVEPYLAPLLLNKVATMRGDCKQALNASVYCWPVKPELSTPLAQRRFSLLAEAVDDILDTAPVKNPPIPKPKPRKPGA
ncbi:MAG: hypothetical protein ACAH83_09680 [Alphaproteobacteria bacterium]